MPARRTVLTRAGTVSPSPSRSASSEGRPSPGDAVAGQSKSIHGKRERSRRVGEDAPGAPVHAYGRSKLATERLLRATAARHGMRYAVLRYFNVAGADPLGRAGPSGADCHLVTAACRAALGPRDGVNRVRHRLPDARRDLRARLHPRLRSGRHPCGGAARPRERRAGPGAQLRLGPRRLGARGARRGAGRIRRRLRRPHSSGNRAARKSCAPLPGSPVPFRTRRTLRRGADGSRA